MHSNFIFINTNPIANMVVSAGITPADYVNGLTKTPDNIILLANGQSVANGYNSHSKFNLLSGAGNIREYLLKNAQLMPKFIDFEAEESLNNLMPIEIAEFLYLAHMGTPMVKKPFSSKLLNRYVYLSLEDGTLKTYYRKFSDFNHILEITIKRKLREAHNTRRVFLRPLAIKDIERQIIIELIMMANDGLFISFGEIKERKKVYQIPLRELNQPEYSTTVLKTARIKEDTKLIGYLIYNLQESKWDLLLD